MDLTSEVVSCSDKSVSSGGLGYTFPWAGINFLGEIHFRWRKVPILLVTASVLDPRVCTYLGKLFSLPILFLQFLEQLQFCTGNLFRQRIVVSLLRSRRRAAVGGGSRHLQLWIDVGHGWGVVGGDHRLHRWFSATDRVFLATAVDLFLKEVMFNDFNEGCQRWSVTKRVSPAK